MSEINPFLTDVPVVVMVTSVRLSNGVLVESQHVDGNRVFGRINQSTRLNADSKYLFGSIGNRLIPHPNGWDDIKPY